MAASLIASQFPAIQSAELQHLGSGWEFDAFLTSDGWVFRFPRRIDSATLFQSEARVHRLVLDSLPSHIRIPRVELTGCPTNAFPYEFAAHRFIQGAPASATGTQLLPTLASQIGTFLGALHSIPVERARAAGVSVPAVNDEGGRKWLEHGIEVLRRLRGLDPAIDRGLSWLEKAPPIARWNGSLQLVHQDLSPDHVLVNEATGEITGVLDWTDTILGDAARDLVFLVTWQGWDFLEKVLAAYPRTIDHDFRSRLREMSQLLSLMWLAYAHEQGAEMEAHVQGVRRAFTRRS